MLPPLVPRYLHAKISTSTVVADYRSPAGTRSEAGCALIRLRYRARIRKHPASLLLISEFRVSALGTVRNTLVHETLEYCSW